MVAVHRQSHQLIVDQFLLLCARKLEWRGLVSERKWEFWVICKNFPFCTKQVVEESQSGEGEKKAEEEIYRCPVCFKEFSCKYELENHREAHPDTSQR